MAFASALLPTSASYRKKPNGASNKMCIRDSIRAICANDLEDLVTIVESAQQVAATALAELRAGNYTYDSAADKYALQKNEELYNAWYDAYSQFALWLAKWEI